MHKKSMLAFTKIGPVPPFAFIDGKPHARDGAILTFHLTDQDTGKGIAHRFVRCRLENIRYEQEHGCTCDPAKQDTPSNSEKCKKPADQAGVLWASEDQYTDAGGFVEFNVQFDKAGNYTFVAYFNPENDPSGYCFAKSEKVDVKVDNFKVDVDFGFVGGSPPKRAISWDIPGIGLAWSYSCFSPGDEFSIVGFAYILGDNGKTPLPGRYVHLYESHNLDPYFNKGEPKDLGSAKTDENGVFKFEHLHADFDKNEGCWNVYNYWVRTEPIKGADCYGWFMSNTVIGPGDCMHPAWEDMCTR